MKRTDKLNVIVPCYKSIEDLPMATWNKIRETNDVKHLLLMPIKLNEMQKVFLSMRWRHIYNQFITEFGFNSNFLEILEREIKIAKMQLQMITTDNLSMQALIEIEKRRLNRIESEIDELPQQSFYEMKAHIDKAMGTYVDLKKVTVKEFYYYIKMLQNKGGE